MSRITIALMVLAGTLAVSAAVGPVSPASAATINVGTIQAQVSDHLGANNGTSSNCIRYSPAASGTPVTSTTFVTNPTEARTAHGYSGFSCPSDLSISSQSAVGVQPSTITSVNDGAYFLLGRVSHYNNPVTVNDDFFSGKLRLLLPGFTTPNTVSFDWQIWETPNSQSSCPHDSWWQGSGNCQDQILFTNQISSGVLTQNGVQYRAVIAGFQKTDTTTCPATPVTGVPLVNEFLTNEGATTRSCVYASLEQIRKVTITKKVVGTNPPAQTFSFGSTGTLAGTPWDPDFTLTANQSVTREILRGDTVTVTEAEVSDEWALTGLACTETVAGVQQPLPQASYDLDNRTLTLTNVPAPQTTTTPDIACTFTNSYTPKATLTLVKQVNGGSAQPSAWTLTATGANAVPTQGTVVSGTSGSTTVTNQRVPAGTYTLSESSATTGYAQVGWSCTGATVNDSTLTLARGANATCTVTNRFATGSLQIRKSIDDPNGGYTGGSARQFQGVYNCGAGYVNVPFTVTTANPFVASGIPTGRTCTVTETSPTTQAGDFLNASFEWATPTYDPSTRQVTIGDGTTATVTVTNPVVQRFGTFEVAKVVTGPGGWTGGNTRTFPVQYSCTLSNGPTTSGTLNVSTAGAVPGPQVPRGSVCTFTETLAKQSGDFAGDHPSYSWVGYTVNPTSVTIGNGTNQTVTVTNTYTRSYGSLTITKVVQGGGYVGTGTPFSVVYDCGAGDVTVQLAASGAASSTTVSNIPAGSTCSLSENPPAESLLDAAHDWGTPSWAPSNTATIVADQTVTRTVTNPTVAVFGKVTVTKTIDNPAALAAGTTFSITVTCTNGYTTSQSIGVGGLLTTPDLPVGTSCTVSEATPNGGLTNPSYAWGPTPADQTKQITTSGQVVAFTVANTTTRVVGTLNVAKTLVDPDGVAAGRAFTGNWTCTYGTGANEVTRTGSFSVTDATDDAVANDILLTSSCTVTETAPSAPSATDPSYYWVTPVPQTVVVNDANPALTTATLTNTVARRTGSFSVSKTVQGPGYVPGSTFDFTWTCTHVGLPGGSVNDSFSLADGATWGGPTVVIPAGASCTVTEGDNPPTAGPSYTWDGVTLTAPGGTQDGRSITFPIPEGAGVQVSALNTISQKTGAITVAKVVNDPDGGFDGSIGFTMTLDCGAAGSFTLAGIANGASKTQSGIPWGTSCTVTETAPAAGAGLRDASFAWSPTVGYAPSQTVVVGETPQTVTVTNTVERVVGSVTLTKLVTDPDGVSDPAATFSGNWTCTYGTGPGAVVRTGSWGPIAREVAVTLATDILLTSNCTATETDPATGPSTDPSYRWGNEVIVGVASVTKVGPNQVTVTNPVVRDTGSITVSKQVTGADSGFLGGTDPVFDIAYTCISPLAGVPDKQSSFKLARDGSETIVDVPFGWPCTITELSPSNDLLVGDGSYAWGPTPAPQHVTLTAQAPTGQVEFVNDIVRRYGTLQVTKVVQSPGDGVVLGAATFSGTYECQYGTDAAITGNWGPITGATGGTFAVPGQFLIGSTCSVTETGPSGGLVDGSWTWDTPALGADVTIGSATATLTVTNTPVRLYGALTISKVIADTTGVKPGTTFGGIWTCTYGSPVQTWTDRFSVGANSTTVAFTAADGRVPATASCEIVEDTLVPGDLVDASYAWDQPTYDPASVVLRAGQTELLTVTNSTHRVYGSVSVAKAISGPATGLVATDRAFTGNVTCKYLDDAPVMLPWSATTSTPDTVDGVLVGSQCSVLEDPGSLAAGPVVGDNSYAWLPPVLYSSPVVVPAAGGQAVTLTVTNPTARSTGDLVITKVVAGEPDALEGYDPQDTFAIGFSCTPPGTPASGTANLADGESTTLSGVPAGSVCTISEPSSIPTPDAAWTWQDPTFTVTTISGDPVATTPAPGGRGVVFTVPDAAIAGGPAPSLNVLVTNTIVRAYGNFSVAKTADPPTGSTVLPDTDIVYTITLTPAPESVPVHDVVITDDLSQVLDHATFDAFTAGFQGAATRTGNVITWNVGTLLPGAPITLTYTVHVNADALGVTLRNAVTGTGDNPPDECLPGEPCTTEHHTPKWTVAKTSDPASGSTVVPGDVITYTLTVANESDVATAGNVVVTDDLSQVLGNASFVAFVGDATGANPPVGNTLTWNAGTLGPDTTKTLVYTVRVNDDAVGVTLRNAVTGTGDNPPESCLPGAPCTTEHHTPKWTVSKTADPISGTEVEAGQTITYTLTATNLSADATASGIVVTDDLSDVLDNATFSGFVGSPAGAAISGAVITWNVGTLAPGAVATLQYRVTVGADTDAVLRNHVTATGATPPQDCADTSAIRSLAAVCATEHPTPAPVVLPPTPPTPTDPVPPPTVPDGGLPATGGNVGGIVVLALVLLGAGAALVLIRRRNRHTI